MRVPSAGRRWKPAQQSLLKSNFPKQAARRGRAGFTLTEVLVASAVASFVLGSLLSVVTLVSREQQRGYVDASLQQQANQLEDKVTRFLRDMSAGQAAIPSVPVSNAPAFFRTIVVAAGPLPMARQQLSYDPSAQKCVLTPDLSQSATVKTLCKPTTTVCLRNMYFFVSERNDGSPDAGAVNVYFQMDDNGAAGRKTAAGASKKTVVTRTFTVAMRNN